MAEAMRESIDESKIVLKMSMKEARLVATAVNQHCCVDANNSLTLDDVYRALSFAFKD